MKNQNNGVFTVGNLLDCLDAFAIKYRKDAKDSIIRNKHMHCYQNSDNINKDLIDAVLIDFINFIGGQCGGNHGLTIKHLEQIRDLHLCKNPDYNIGGQESIRSCYELEDGTLWVERDRKETCVSFCPFCGCEAKTKLIKENMGK